MSNLITKYKHEDLYLTTNTNVKLKKKKSSNDVSLAASAILFRKLCRLFHSIFGRDGRGSKSGRRPIEHTGIVIPIPAALPLAQTNWLLYYDQRKLLPEMDPKVGLSNIVLKLTFYSVCLSSLGPCSHLPHRRLHMMPRRNSHTGLGRCWQ